MTNGPLDEQLTTFAIVIVLVFLFFSVNIYDQTIVTNRLQQKSRIPLWVSQDMEFGAAIRIPQIVGIDQLPETINTQEHRLIADHIPKKSITLLRNKDQPLPLNSNRFETISVVNINDGRRQPDNHISRALDGQWVMA